MQRKSSTTSRDAIRSASSTRLTSEERRRRRSKYSWSENWAEAPILLPCLLIFHNFALHVWVTGKPLIIELSSSFYASFVLFLRGKGNYIMSLMLHMLRTHKMTLYHDGRNQLQGAKKTPQQNKKWVKSGATKFTQRRRNPWQSIDAWRFTGLPSCSHAIGWPIYCLQGHVNIFECTTENTASFRRDWMWWESCMQHTKTSEPSVVSLWKS